MRGSLDSNRVLVEERGASAAGEPRGPGKRTGDEILAAIEASPLRFTKPDVKRETRE